SLFTSCPSSSRFCISSYVWKIMYRSSGGGGGIGFWVNADDDIYLTVDHSAIYHYNGQIWNDLSKVIPQGFYISNAIWADSKNDVYIGGVLADNFTPGVRVFHYDGNSWSVNKITATTSNALVRSIWGTGQNNIYFLAGPVYTLNNRQDILIHYDGTTYTELGTVLDTDPYLLQGGVPWTPLLSPFFVNGGTMFIYGTDSSHIYVAGGTGLYQVITGTSTIVKDPYWKQVNAIWGDGHGTLYLYGYTISNTSGLFVSTGASWNNISLPITGDVGYIWGSSPDNIYVYIMTPEHLPSIYNYNGTTWVKEVSPSPSNPIIVGLSANDVYTAGESCLESSDGAKYPGFVVLKKP
ncbi:MAG: hypothetical protein ACPL1H_00230, partial [bacterium]